MQWRRWWRHVLAWRPGHEVLRADQAAQLAQRVSTMEALHHAEIRICLERHWPWAWALGASSTRDRALHWFIHERGWDTENNSGILLYVSLADRAIEIVADRGLAWHIDARQWESVLQAMRSRFAQADYFQGLLDSLSVLQSVLDATLPRAQSNPDELPNPVLIK